MNYRHAFHAGNFADVFKHAALARILIYMARKDGAFRVVETHAGAGSYGLDASEAERTGEWIEGIGRLLASDLPASVRELLKPWLGLVEGMMARQPRLYPGSPLLAQHLTRAQDRLVFCEKHPGEVVLLADSVGRDRRAKVLSGDGWTHLSSLLPPPERRGIVVIDPPFEEEREFARIVVGLANALRRFATGVYFIWYPIKSRREVEAFARHLATLPVARILRAEIGRFKTERVDRLNGCGIAVVNPPWKFDEEVLMIAKTFAPILAREEQGIYRVEWLKFE